MYNVMMLQLRAYVFQSVDIDITNRSICILCFKLYFSNIALSCDTEFTISLK